MTALTSNWRAATFSVTGYKLYAGSFVPLRAGPLTNSHDFVQGKLGINTSLSRAAALGLDAASGPSQHIV
jgi:hypothetical protein